MTADLFKCGHIYYKKKKIRRENEERILLFLLLRYRIMFFMSFFSLFMYHLPTTSITHISSILSIFLLKCDRFQTYVPTLSVYIHSVIYNFYMLHLTVDMKLKSFRNDYVYVRLDLIYRLLLSGISLRMKRKQTNMITKILKLCW